MTKRAEPNAKLEQLKDLATELGYLICDGGHIVKINIGAMEERAEPNEHARLKEMLHSAANILAEEEFTTHAMACGSAAAEIERLAARVRELERPRYDANELRAKVVSSFNDNPIEAQRVHETLAAIHGFSESSPIKKRRGSGEQNSDVPR